MRVKSCGLLFFAVFFLSCMVIQAQDNTKNDYTGIWQDNNSWVDGSQQPITGIGPGEDINIYGYITKGTSGDATGISFGSNNDGDDFIVRDTLVVFGDVDFANKAMNLVIPVGGVMIVFGDFSATNKITLSNGGILVITGDANFSPSPQDNYVDGGGEFFVEGTVSGNSDASTADTNSGPLASSGYTAIKDFVGNNGATPLPIDLVYFTAKQNENTIELDWATTSEENFDYFIIEHSDYSFEFQSIGELQGNGGHGMITSYHYIDEAPLVGINYYRLKSIDYDGTFDYHPIVSVDFTGNFSRELLLYPNPASMEFTLRPNFDFVKASIAIKDIDGRLVLTDIQEFPAKRFTIPDGLNSGVYFIEFQTAEGRYVEKLIIEK